MATNEEKIGNCGDWIPEHAKVLQTGARLHAPGSRSLSPRSNAWKRGSAGGASLGSTHYRVEPSPRQAARAARVFAPRTAD